MVQKEVVNTLIKKGLRCVLFFLFFFFLRNKNVNGNFFSFFFPPGCLSLFGIHIHFGFDLLSSLNEFIQTM